MSELCLVVFDVDGTLIDSQAQIVAAMSDMYAAGGRTMPPRERLLSIVGLSLNQAVAALEPDLSEAEVQRWADAYRASFLAIRAKDQPSPLYPGAQAALDRLRAHDHVLLGIATGKARRGLDHLIEAHGLQSYFVTLQTADHHPSKPHPAMLETALLEAGVDAAQAVIVGDTTFDMNMGAAAGVGTIGVTWGYHPRPALAAAQADRIVSRFEDLDQAVSELLGGLS